MTDEPTRRLSTLAKPISPPPASARPIPSLSALEAGKESVNDHLQTISAHLRKHAPNPRIRIDQPLLPIDAWASLYTRNQHKHGRHFVIHQHDHPIAGPHYDLRLQFSESSSLSWSIMYGLPGDPNSRRLNRNATETRVHCLWNHLIETASPNTGSMIIWDTGEYEVLPDKPKTQRGSGIQLDTASETDESDTPAPNPDNARSQISDSEKLRRAFQNHKIRLRLHGTRLPRNYTIFLRRDKSDHRSAPTPASLLNSPRKRKRRRTAAKPNPEPVSTESSESDANTNPNTEQSSGGTNKRKAGTPAGEAETKHSTEHSDTERDPTSETDFQIRLHNAYPGAVNDIGSIHQRRWFIVLDRTESGFVPQKEIDKEIDTRSGSGRRTWVRGVAVDKPSGERTLTGFDPFYVMGPDVERSVLTGRLGSDVLRDEGVEGFIPRRGWRRVLE